MASLEWAPQLKGGLGDDVAASIQALFKANIAKILDDLKSNGVTQDEIAKAFGAPPSQISKLKSGDYFPSGQRMDELLEALNKFAVPEIQAADLFRDPSQALMAERDLIAELARRAGYRLIKDS